VRARRKSVTAVANGAASGDGDGLDWKRCDRARLARDPRFDGRFFTGVLTTRIYCRPTVPGEKPGAIAQRCLLARRPRPSALDSGRACCRRKPRPERLRARRRGDVSRALRLIERGFLDDGKTVEDLAGTLGMTTRHLRRLFDRYAGAPPTAVATTRRVQRAKRLIDETTMPMSEIAFAAGFASIRRFNAAFRAAYRRPPTAVRRSLRHRPLVGQVASQRA
jgi:AraC family transcriptional regulator of adaptative response / DNA-3-methyladenine glycosylase II